MAASKETTFKVLTIIRKYVPDSVAKDLFKELLSVEGNTSFKTTIKNFNKLYDK